METCEYKGMAIFEDFDHDTWSYCCRTGSHKLPSGNRIEFNSEWYRNEHFDAKTAIDSVKAQIDDFIVKQTIPDVFEGENPNVILRAKYFFYASNPTQWGYSSERINEYCKKEYQDAAFSRISEKIDIIASWTDDYDNYIRTNEEITKRNKRERVKEFSVFGRLDEKYTFVVTCKDNSKYIEIEVKDEQHEFVADRIVQLTGIYEAKEFALELKSKE